MVSTRSPHVDLARDIIGPIFDPYTCLGDLRFIGPSLFLSLSSARHQFSFQQVIYRNWDIQLSSTLRNTAAHSVKYGVTVNGCGGRSQDRGTCQIKRIFGCSPAQHANPSQTRAHDKGLRPYIQSLHYSFCCLILILHRILHLRFPSSSNAPLRRSPLSSSPSSPARQDRIINNGRDARVPHPRVQSLRGQILAISRLSHCRRHSRQLRHRWKRPALRPCADGARYPS